MFKIKLSFIVLLLSTLVVPFSVNAQLSVDPGFNPSKIIDDKVFSDVQTFGGAAGIQKFLETKASVLANTSPDFLLKLKEPQASLLKQGLEDPQPNLGRLRTAAELIWDAAQHSGLNPQVIIVTLEKEQSLITGRKTSDEATLQKALDRALGFGCPDGGGCDNIYAGFYFQLFGNFDATASRYLGAAKSLMKSFTTPGGRGPAVNGVASKVGDAITLENTTGDYAGVLPNQSIVIGNNATAALYRFTPHIFNGNYNFWKFFNSWFRYPNNTVIKLSTSSDLYLIQNGVKHPVPAFVLQIRGLSSANAITASQTEFDSYPTDKLLGPSDNSVVKVSGSEQYYVFINNERRPASSFVISQRGLNPNTAITISEAEAAMFVPGPQLTPSPGTVLRGKTAPAIYLVGADNSLQLYTAFTFAQHKVANKVQIIPDSEIESYPKKGFVLPLDGTVMKADNSQTVYLLEGGAKRALTAELFKNRKISISSIAVLPSDIVAGYPESGFATPANMTWFEIAKSGALYLFKEGERHYIPPFVAKQRSITPDYSFDEGIVASWREGSAIPPRDNTLIKGDKDGTVYVVLKSVLRPLTAATFKAKRYSFKNVIVIPQTDLDKMPKGDVM